MVISVKSLSGVPCSSMRDIHGSSAAIAALSQSRTWRRPSSVTLVQHSPRFAAMYRAQPADTARKSERRRSSDIPDCARRPAIAILSASHGSAFSWAPRSGMRSMSCSEKPASGVCGRPASDGASAKCSVTCISPFGDSGCRIPTIGKPSSPALTQFGIPRHSRRAASQRLFENRGLVLSQLRESPRKF
jgi:hypothetical protein